MALSDETRSSKPRQTPKAASGDLQVVALLVPFWVSAHAFIQEKIQQPWDEDHKFSKRPFLIRCPNLYGLTVRRTMDLIRSAIRDKTRKVVLCDAMQALKELSIVPSELVLLDENLVRIVQNTQLVDDHSRRTFSEFLTQPDCVSVLDNLSRYTVAKHQPGFERARVRFNECCAKLQELASIHFKDMIRRKLVLISSKAPTDPEIDSFQSEEEAVDYLCVRRPHDWLLEHVAFGLWFKARGGVLSHLEKIEFRGTTTSTKKDCSRQRSPQSFDTRRDDSRSKEQPRSSSDHSRSKEQPRSSSDDDRHRRPSESHHSSRSTTEKSSKHTSSKPRAREVSIVRERSPRRSSDHGDRHSSRTHQSRYRPYSPRSRSPRHRDRQHHDQRHQHQQQHEQPHHNYDYVPLAPTDYQYYPQFVQPFQPSWDHVQEPRRVVSFVGPYAEATS